MFYNNCCCSPTYLVTNVFLNDNQYVMQFRTQPTMTNGGTFNFRLANNITTVATAGLPIVANVTVNGETVLVPLLDCIGNAVRTGDGDLRTRTTYTAVFGGDSNHIQIVKVNGKSCLEV